MTAVSADFDVFWQAYPRRDAKKDAIKAWNQLRPSAELLQTILAALSWQRQTDQWKRKVIPLPASYLRGERWTDEGLAGATPQPVPAPQIEFAKSIARKRAAERADDLEQGQRALHQREQDLIAHGVPEPEAIIQASREWLKAQK